jgi:hypothetical protein
MSARTAGARSMGISIAVWFVSSNERLVFSDRLIFALTLMVVEDPLHARAE